MSNQPQPNSVPGHPATPRMLRSVSGNLRNAKYDVEDSVSPGQKLGDEFGPNRSNSHSRNSSVQQVQPGPSQAAFDANLMSPQTPSQKRVISNPMTPNRQNPTTMNPKVISQMAGMTPNPSQAHQVTVNTKNELLPPASISTNMANNSTLDSKISKKKDPPAAVTPGQNPQQPFHRKSIGDWDFVKTIGAGSMGKVKLAQHNSTGEICAVKIVPRAAKIYQRAHAEDPTPKDQQDINQRQKEYEKELERDKRTTREGALGRLLFHPYICRLYEIVPMTNHYYMLFEYVEGGQMLDYIVAHGSLKERHARKFARGIASALDYCHRNNVVHRDLKIENIMINEKGDIKIIDFGLSNLYSPKSLLKTYCGSLYFAAPELLSAKPYVGPEVDIWSFGVVLYVLVCGKVPFDDQSVSVLHEKIKKANVEYPSFLSKEFVSLLSKMLRVEPTRRCSLYEVMHHPWMNKGYEYGISSHVPKRIPLRLPLDSEIINAIASFDLGNRETLTDELNNIVGSMEYQMSSENWYRIVEQGREYGSASNSHILPDPTGGFHPLVSIYYLVDEMKKRKKAKEQLVKAQLDQAAAAQAVTPSQVAETAQIAQAAPAKPEIISLPQQAYTPNLPSYAPSESMTSGDEAARPQQTLDPKSNVLLRFSGGPNSPPKSGSPEPRDPMVRRGVSMKVTAKEKLDSSIQVETPPVSRQPTSVSPQTSESRPRAAPMAGPQSHESKPMAKTRPHARSASINAPGKHGFVPVEYLPPLPSIDSATNQIVPNKVAGGMGRKLHPTARSKSLGGHVKKKPQTADAKGPTLGQNSDEKVATGAEENEENGLYDGYFDDILLDDESEYPEIPQLTEEEIINQFNNAKPNTMPSIEYPKTLFLKGFFSVQTTSTKPLPVIRYNIINVLTRLGVKFQEVEGGFVCAHSPSLNTDDSPSAELVAGDAAGEQEKLYGDAFTTTSAEEEPGFSANMARSNNSSRGPSRQPSMLLLTPRQHKHLTSISSVGSGDGHGYGHRRKFSIGNSILRRKNGSQTQLVMPNTPAAARINKLLYGDDDDFGDLKMDDDSIDSVGNLMIGGGSDMLSSRIEHRKTKIKRSPLKFEIHVVKFPLVGLYGIQFKKLLGNTWNYKTLASQLLNELKL